MTTTPKYSPYGGFSEGDHVTRDGTDVHLVSNMTDDGFSADFVCIVAPEQGWSAVGETERNICRRYTEVRQDPATGGWVEDPHSAIIKRIAEVEMYESAEKIRAITTAVARLYANMMKMALHRKFDPLHQQKIRRHNKRRAMRK